MGSRVVSKMGRGGLLLVCLFALVPQAPSQTAPTPHEDAKTFAYEVASIRPAKPSDGMSWNTTVDGFTAKGASARWLIMNAYDLITEDQLSGLPEWANTEQFDLQAKVDADTSEALKKLSGKEKGQQYDHMLQALLAGRFNLKIRRETKPIPVYALVVAKGGAKLKETPVNTPMDYAWNSGGNGSTFSGHGIETGNLASNLSGTVGRLIVDKTGLTGKYDVELKWSSEDNPGSGDSGPSIFTALQEQLGLKLESTKAPVETIVVEHIDKPSEN
jgi:uncharacterized protein (TIGR03435 family)